jgi:ribosome-associated toxin RatA of RatAB toxin-antitoxin module
MPKSVRSIVIQAPPDKCYAVIADFEKYPEFVSELKKAKVLSRDKNRSRIEFTIKVLKEINYTLDITGEPPTGLRWTLFKGFMKKNDGGWKLKDVGGGRTEATYEVDVEFGLMVPSSVIKMLQENNLPKMLEAFKKRIETLNRA